jgi:predicted nucleotidyltransferase
MLEKIIPSKVRRKLLTLLLTNPDAQFYVREAARKIGEPADAALKELRNLEAAGMAYGKRRGNLQFYCADKSSPIFKEMRSIIIKTGAFGGAIASSLEKIPGIRFAFVFGSFSQGRERQSSDIDLMVIGTPDPYAISSNLKPVERALSRQIHFVIYPEKELGGKRSGFLQGTLSGSKIWLRGDRDEFERLVAR